MSNLTIELLKRHEWFRSKIYICPDGKRTVSYGRNLDDVGITEHEATILLREDIKRAENVLKNEFYWDSLNEARRSVVINMVVNLGWMGFKGFRLTREALTRCDYQEAANQMERSLWYDQVGDRARELVEIMRSGECSLSL